MDRMSGFRQVWEQTCACDRTPFIDRPVCIFQLCHFKQKCTLLSWKHILQSMPSQPGENRVEFESRSVKTLEFSPAQEFSQALPRFSPGYEGTENMFYFFYKIIIFRINKEKDNIRSAYVFFHETVNSHNLETANHYILYIWYSKI